MDKKALIQQLNNYDTDERIYREFYLLQQAGQDLDDFFSAYQEYTEELQHLRHPELIITYQPEDRYIHSGCNAAILKHPRFFPFFWHKHYFFEAIYVLSGTCTQVFHEQEIKLKSGDLCIMAPGVEHGIEVFDDSVILNILIRRSTFLDIFINTIRDKTQISMFFLNNIYEKNKIPYLLFHTGKDKLIRNYILDMYQEQQHRDEYSDRIICSILTIFFTQLVRLHKEHLEIPSAHQDLTGYETEIFNYILNHYADLTLEHLAEHFHFSVPYCSKLIKKISGSTYSDLLEKIRLQQSENYLLYTQMSVADISEKLGFQNPETFIRMFKRRHNMTPGKFRKLHTNT